MTVTAPSESRPVLEVEDLVVHFRAAAPAVNAVDGLTFDLWPGEVLCLVGESGSGKTATALAILRLLTPNTATIRGAIRIGGTDVARCPERQMRQIRGRRVGFVFQDPSTALTPVLTVGGQLIEVIRRHLHISGDAARERALQLLRQVEIPDSESVLGAYPHQLSGGMRQRVVIALALSCGPELLVADEPTTALDVTIQQQILRLLWRLARATDTGIVLITHNFGVVAEVADRVVVMYAGRVVEEGAAREVVRRPRHPYTEALLDSVPRLTTPRRQPLKSIPGQPPSSRERLPGCPFHPRCPLATPDCRTAIPPLVHVQDHRQVACWERMPAEVAGTR